MSLTGDVYLGAPGGKGANAAVAAARLDARTALIGCVGADDRGREVVSSLAAEGVNLEHVRIDSTAPTGAAVIQVEQSGQKQILAALGANLRLQVDHVNRAAAAVAAGRLLLMQLEVPVDCVAVAARIARDGGRLVVIYPAPPRDLPDDLVARANVIRGNAGE